MWLRECQYTMTDDDDVGNKEKSQNKPGVTTTMHSPNKH